MPAPYRLTLSSHPSTRACVEAIDALHRAYKAAFKRNPTVALLCSTTCGREAIEEEGIKATADTFAVVLMAADMGAQAPEVAWFRAQTSPIPLSS